MKTTTSLLFLTAHFLFSLILFADNFSIAPLVPFCQVSPACCAHQHHRCCSVLAVQSLMESAQKMHVVFRDMFGYQFFEEDLTEREDDQCTVGDFKRLIHQLQGICPHHQLLTVSGREIPKAKASANIFDFLNTVIKSKESCEIQVRYLSCRCSAKENSSVKKVPPEALDDLLCRVCYLDKASVVTLPCSHLVCCRSCYDRLEDLGIDNCAACRADVVSVIEPAGHHCPCKCSFFSDNSATRKKEEDSAWCQLCGNRSSSMLFKPCGHLASCSACVQQKLTNCPVCGKRISSKIPVFRA